LPPLSGEDSDVDCETAAAFADLTVTVRKLSGNWRFFLESPCESRDLHAK
jgi:hypothetical protein